MIRRPPRSTHCISSAASDVYKRQSMNDIVKQMKNFEKQNAIELPCLKIEGENRKKLAQSLMLDIAQEEPMNEKPPEHIAINTPNIEQNNKTSLSTRDSCTDCANTKKAKARLACKHTICKDCILSSVLTKFTDSKPYKYAVLCATCKTHVKIGIFSFIMKESIMLSCGCQWTQMGQKMKNAISFDCTCTYKFS
eukprot:TRINITY_DN3212_c0_g1_i1.p1 TRINITY_DN3212_c0_g1~~TRINITY_DN3212_c0_g1_i1.p1  ORF type:complete len:222 (+),score=49.96 TRINITY_DN3212_c0_g1_i1:87-668(+)